MFTDNKLLVSNFSYSVDFTILESRFCSCKIDITMFSLDYDPLKSWFENVLNYVMYGDSTPYVSVSLDNNNVHNCEAYDIRKINENEVSLHLYLHDLENPYLTKQEKMIYDLMESGNCQYELKLYDVVEQYKTYGDLLIYILNLNLS